MTVSNEPGYAMLEGLRKVKELILVLVMAY
jgi:hypothetical protein